MPRAGTDPSPWASGACLIAGAMTPLLFHPFGTLGFEATKSVVVRLLALILILGWIARRAGRLRFPLEPAEVVSLPGPIRWIALATVGYISSQLLSTGVSIAPGLSFWGSYDRVQGILTVLAWAALGAAAALVGRHDSIRLIDGWLLASVPVCVYGAAQQANLDPIDWLARPLGVTSTLGSSTALGEYLAMLVPVSLVRTVVAGAALREPRRSGRDRRSSGRSALVARRRSVYAGWVALLTLQVAVLLMAQVRGALVGSSIGLGVATSAILWYRRPALARGVLLAAVVAALAIGLAASSGSGRSSEPRPASSGAGPSGAARIGVAQAGAAQAGAAQAGAAQAGDVDSSVWQRLLIWRAALDTVRDGGWRTLVGFGPETQALALEAHFPAELAKRYPDARFDRAHNLLLDQLLTSGVLGVLAALAPIGALLAGGAATPRRANPDEATLHEENFSAGLTGALAASLAANVYAFSSIATGTLFWMIAGLLAGGVWRRSRRSEPSERILHGGRGQPAAVDGLGLQRRTIAQLAAAAVGAALVPWLLGPLVADLYHTRALALRAGESPAASVAEEQSAHAWWPAQDAYLIALGETYLDLARTTSARESTVPASLADLARAIPTGRDGLFEAARFAVERAVELSPLDPYSHFQGGQLAASWGEATTDPNERTTRLEWALDAHSRAGELSPNRALFHDAVGLAASQLGQADLAIARFRRADDLDGMTSERTARIGDAEASRGNATAAREHYEQALAMDPRSAAAEHGLARLDRAAASPESAADHAERAVRYQMRNWEYRRHLATLYLELERWSPALAEARTARRLAPAWEWDGLDALIEAARRGSPA